MSEFHSQLFHGFDEDISEIGRPERLNFPFYYDVHPLAKLASEQLQTYLTGQTSIDHNFGLDPTKEGLVIGKMFGVLVGENPSGDLGFLAAFSGKLSDSNFHLGFVPPIYDVHQLEGFFKSEEAGLNELNRQIEDIETSTLYLEAKKSLKILEQELEDLVNDQADRFKRSKEIRQQWRKKAKQLLPTFDAQVLHECLNDESKVQHFHLKKLKEYCQSKLEKEREDLEQIERRIQTLKTERRNRSHAIQHEIFKQYRFLNADGEQKDLLDIFRLTSLAKPPSGAGECAAPKLFQYAYDHDIRPITFAEFWWGASPRSKVRRHKNYYPSCRGKCEPILTHMLQGLSVDENPMQHQLFDDKELKIIYEDESIVVVHKPAEFLSVPGKTISDSVYTRMAKKYPLASGPLIVHRLDMSTSGLMVIALNKRAHHFLQGHFIRRHVEKRYMAILDGEVKENEGFIDLPLRVDLDDRPRQLVCYEHGKSARTRFEVLGVKDGQTRIHFYPITGRTHQLRVHAAHSLGLNAPIVGDDLYGSKDKRLCLHAEYLAFEHPTTRQKMVFEVPAEF